MVLTFLFVGRLAKGVWAILSAAIAAATAITTAAAAAAAAATTTAAAATSRIVGPRMVFIHIHISHFSLVPDMHERVHMIIITK